MATAPAVRAARAGSAGAAAVEPPAGRAGAEGAGLWAAVGPAVARPTGRASSPQPGLVQGAAGLVDDYRIADDSLPGAACSPNGPAAFVGAPLDAAGSAEAPLAASAVRQLALAIGQAVSGDVRQLSVQLSPEALGGLEITVDFADERRVAVTILAERPETLDLLRGETRQLERLLGQQGVSLAAGGFELGLMADGRGQRREHAGAGPGQGASIDLADTQDAATATTAAPPLRRGLLNLSV
ncbi:MAG: flagellar hook-length control protein FliK [Geminicoccaceae bacterium]